MGSPVSVETPMPYVVKAVSTDGTVAWLHCADSTDIPSLSIRETAEIYPSVYEAGKALAKMPFAHELVFYIEEIDGEARAAG
jgi:hypothetical protein